MIDQKRENLLNLALWVGGFVLVAIYKLEVDRDELQAGGDQVSRYLADALNPYITGSMSGFNGQTNVDLMTVGEHQSLDLVETILDVVEVRQAR